VTRLLMDTTALFKRYLEEPGSERVLALSDQARSMVVAAHCKSELAAAINRQKHDGLVAADDYLRIMTVVQQDFAAFDRVELDRRVEAFAIAAMERSRLCAIEALHIATAQAAGVDLFVTADRRQAAAAGAAGLKTELIEA
jgi:predicted nucleic acid-binding protein